MTTIFDNDLRTLSDNELIYNISNKAIESDITFDEFIASLSPSKKKLALNVIELYRRNIMRVSEQKVMTCSSDIYDFIKPYLYGLDHEEFWAIFMNQSSRAIKVQRFSMGGITFTAVDIRMILKEAFLCNATHVVICHNHPSGNVRPSKEDDRTTQKAKEAFATCDIRLLDHIVVCNDKYYSYIDEGKL